MPGDRSPLPRSGLVAATLTPFDADAVVALHAELEAIGFFEWARTEDA